MSACGFTRLGFWHQTAKACRNKEIALKLIRQNILKDTETDTMQNIKLMLIVQPKAYN